MTVTNAQVRKMNEEYSKCNDLTLASLKSGMDRKTARKYRDAGKLPSELKKPRTWRTREDAFEEDWPALKEMLVDAPELEAKSLFEYLLDQKPDKYQQGQLRTLQRRVREWRALSGPPKDVFFPQKHRPGEAMQTDFTRMGELGITIDGAPFSHMLCHEVLPYSNWEWGTICHSESIPALRCGVQDALFRLGRRPIYHQTDNSTAATHHVNDNKRQFNDKYKALMDHLGMTPRTTGIGKKEQNGDVEASHRVLKRRMKQHLLLRGSSDFDSVDDYRRFLDGVMDGANKLRTDKVKEELGAMKLVLVDRLPDHSKTTANVSKWSTIRVKHNSYSVPSRLIDERVQVRLYDDRLEVFFSGVRQMTADRLHGRFKHRIDYRHVIWSLVKKPGAFQRYRFRSDMFPTVTFREAYDRLVATSLTEREADLAYLRVLHLAASTMEADVQIALECLLEAGELPLPDAVKALVLPIQEPSIPEMLAYNPDLSAYDSLLGEGVQ
ncbi:MAG: IS21 family transposase [Gammaproteobacteria bacterium]|nr:IS21 family transposase [Gammaproteobacteria bacterium]